MNNLDYKTLGGLKTSLRNAHEIKATENARRIQRQIRRLNAQKDKVNR